MIDNDELLIAILGSDRVAAFREVMGATMRVANIVREVIADDLNGTLPAKGKQFLTTNVGLFRLASRPNSDNSTEQRAHRRMGAQTVQVFGELSDFQRAKGWITVEELYQLHGVRFNARTVLRKVVRRFGRLV